MSLLKNFEMNVNKQACSINFIIFIDITIDKRMNILECLDISCLFIGET